MTAGKKTKLYGVIGCPIGHTLSPAMHNAAFKRLGIDAVYLALEVRPEGLKEAVRGIQGLGFGGVNITIPHKQAVISYLDNLGREARLIGAVNTIVNSRGVLTGHNTDAYGFIRSLKEDLKFTPKDKTVFVMGAGGAAKAVVFALILEGASRIILADKIDEKALELACEAELKTGCECIVLKMGSPGMRDMILNSHLLVNATPVGMKASDGAAVDPGFLHKGLCVFDLVYNRRTALINSCLKKGIAAAGGLNMLLYQGARAFELWTGKKAPIETMRRVLWR